MKQHNRGFTLVELLVSMTVLVILITIAVPSFYSLIQNNQARALGNSVATALNFARSEAIKRNTAVQVCPGSSTNCNGSWTDGWRVQISGGAVLREWEAPDAGAVFTPAAPGAITFTGNGRLSTAAIAITTRYVNCTGDRQRTIRINSGGRVSVSPTNCP